MTIKDVYLSIIASVSIVSSAAVSAEAILSQDEWTVSINGVMEEVVVVGIKPKNPAVDFLFVLDGLSYSGETAGWQVDIDTLDNQEEKLDAALDNCDQLLVAQANMSYCNAEPGNAQWWLTEAGNLKIYQAVLEEGIDPDFYTYVIEPAAQASLYVLVQTMDQNDFAQAVGDSGLIECQAHHDQIAWFYDLEDCHEDLAQITIALADQPSQINLSGFNIGPLSFDVTGLRESFAVEFKNYMACRAWYRAWDNGDCVYLLENFM